MDRRLIGVEIGGAKLQLALGTPQGELLETRRAEVSAAHGAAGILAWLKEELPTLAALATNYHAKISAIGVGFGGPIDNVTGRALQSVQIPGWQDFPLIDWFETQFGLPTCVENDSNAAAWGEYRRGAGRGAKNFFYTNIGSGIGGGLIIDGALYNAGGCGAGEFGHTYVPDWSSNTPGAAVQLENLCSGWAIEKRLRAAGYVPEDSLLYKLAQGIIERIDCRLLGQAAATGDPFALQEIERVAASLGLALANVQSLFNPDLIAIGGGVANMGEVLLEPIRRHAQARKFVTSRGRIVACELKDTVVLVGAILLAEHRLFLS
jgi:glucokinase